MKRIRFSEVFGKRTLAAAGGEKVEIPDTKCFAHLQFCGIDVSVLSPGLAELSDSPRHVGIAGWMLDQKSP